MRWLIRVSVLLGLTAGLLTSVAAPAQAHGTTQHTISLSGTVNLRDFDWPDADDVCNRNIQINDTAQLPIDGQATLNATPSCDEARLKIRFTATLDSNGNFAVRGTFRLEERDCGITCGHDHIGTRSSSFTLGPLGSRTVSDSFGDDQASTSYTVTFANSF